MEEIQQGFEILYVEDAANSQDGNKQEDEDSPDENRKKIFCIYRSSLLLDLGKKENIKVHLLYVGGEGQQTKN